MSLPLDRYCFFFFFNDTATTEIYTLSLHDALPICDRFGVCAGRGQRGRGGTTPGKASRDRKSTRLNSSHSQISYAVFCLKKKKQENAATTAAVADLLPQRRCTQALSATETASSCVD